MVDADLNPQVIARVREAADITEIIGDHVRLRRRGRKWEGLCPFHEEKTPSFSVDAEKGLYYCFGCHKGGDVFKFVMEHENLSFPEAVERLARRYGVKLPPRSPQARNRARQADSMRGILEEAQRFFVRQLASSAGRPARDELARRDFPESSWSSFGFGFAPDDWRALMTELASRHREGAIVDSGLAVRPEGGNAPYDRFRNRLTFPIRAGDGSLVGFGGRILGDGEPKYLNSPESVLFSKRSTLFCLDRARRALAESGEGLVVEGYFDCLSLHRVGIINAVATLGTALTNDHARLLRRRVGADGRVLLCYDADDAGRRAAAGGARVLLEAGTEVAIVELPSGEDPDDVVRDRGVDAFRALVARPTPLLHFLLADLPQDPGARRRAGLRLAPLVCCARDPAVRQNLVEELARQLYLRPSEIEEAGREPRRGAPARPRTRSTLPPGERELVRILLECPPSWRRTIIDIVEIDLIEDRRVRAVLETVAPIAASEADPAAFAHDLVHLIENEEISTFIAEVANAPMPEVTDETIRTQLRTLIQRQSKEQARRLAPLIAAAEERGDAAEIDRLLAEKARIRRNLAEI